MAQIKSSRHSKANFATLEPRIRNVNAATIKKRWKKLHPNAQDKVKQMLSALKQQSRMSKRKGFDPSEIDNCVDDIADRLMLRLPRMPFPPSTDEAHFDFEATLTRIQTLEDQLISNIQSMNLLRTQIVKEERMLAMDKQELEQLKQAMRSSEALRRKQDKNLHPLARRTQEDSQMDENNSHSNTELRGNEYDEATTERLDSATFAALEEDERVNPLLQQLRSHLESMRNNTAEMKSVGQAVGHAQIALDDFTCRALDRDQYNAVYGLQAV